MKSIHPLLSANGIISRGKLILLLVYTCIFTTAAKGQASPETGSQAIINYSPKEYDATEQNWGAAQDKNGIMYFGNNNGLLEFDGATWRFYQVPNKSAIRSLAIGTDGKIYTGAQGDLGYFQADSTGKLQFHSLMKFIPEDRRDFADVFQTYAGSGKIYFRTANSLLTWDFNLKQFHVVHSENGFQFMSIIKGIIYVNEKGKGLEISHNDSLVLLKEGEKFANEKIYVMLPFPGGDGAILLATRNMGLFKYQNNNLIPFRTAADQFIKDSLLLSPGAVLSDGNILLGTINGGAVIIDSMGRELFKYNKQKGIIDNTVIFPFQDRSGAIWLATGNGISRAGYSSPVSYFDARNNMTSIANDFIRYNGIIYAATQTGFYYLDQHTLSFQVLKNSRNVARCFIDMGDELISGGNEGLFRITKDRLFPIGKSIGDEYPVDVLKRSGLNPFRIYVATSKGLRSVVKTGNDWKDEGEILDNKDQHLSIVEDNDGKLWVGTISSGLFAITFQKDANGNIMVNNPVIEHFGKTNGLEQGQVWPIKISGVNYFNTTDSIYKFNGQKKFFYSDTSDKIISAYYNVDNGNANNLFQEDSLERTWIATKGKLAMGSRQPSGFYKWTSNLFNSFANENIYKVYAEKNGNVWFGTGSGIIRYDFTRRNVYDNAYAALVRTVVVGEDSIIYSGGNVDRPVIPEIKFTNNSVKFGFAATSYEGRNANQFKTFLVGFDNVWSSWSKETFKGYTNLPPGKYTFKVAAVNIAGIKSSTGTYSFEILPPWYRTWWAYCIYAILAIGLLWLMVIYRSRQLTKKNQALERKVEHRTAQLNQSLHDLRSTQAQLIQSEKMASLGELTAGIAHEIQNPLNFVNNFSEVNKELLAEMKEELKKGNLEEAEAIAKDIVENEQKINHHGRRADAIIKGMLQHSRTGTGVKEPTDINALCDEYLRMSYHGFRAKNKEFNTEIKTEFDKSIGKINVIPQDIGRVLLNLYNNAFYALDEKQKTINENYRPGVSVSTKMINNKMELTVTDNGNGIPQKIVDKIFQPFFTTKPTGEGTGLGLSLSYDIIKAHGGEIKVETNEGEGTVFIIQLPL